MQQLEPIQRLSDPQLLAEVAQLARRSHHDTARLVAHLAELDARKLYLQLEA